MPHEVREAMLSTTYFYLKTQRILREWLAFLLITHIWLLFFFTSSVAYCNDDGTHFVWFGCYTNKKSGGEGIYVARFDANKGTLTQPTLAIAARNPSFLALHPKLPVLYAVSEAPGLDGKPSGAIASFKIDTSNGSLQKINHQSSGGAGPCHLSVDPHGQVVLAANYRGGSTVCLGLTDNGHLKPASNEIPGGFIQHSYNRSGEIGINEQRQSEPHGHSADIFPNGRFAFVCDLGLDEVLIYKLDPTHATIQPHSSVSTQNGAGPRHFALHPNQQYAYCVNELDLSVTAFSFDADTGTLTAIQSISTLPKDVTDRTGFSCAEIATHPSGHFLYASNRGHNSITTFRIDESTGRLSFRDTVSAHVDTPRHFALSPNGKHLLAEGQKSNSVAIFTIDPSSGMLGFTGESIVIPSPVSAVFKPLQ